ncbi:MAG: sulfate transporter [Prevotella sp.]|nr:sulfate transporter [Prevotella sp.]
MMSNVGYYIFVLVALMVAFIVVKKVASCMIKTAVLIALIVILAVVYWLYFM